MAPKRKHDSMAAAAATATARADTKTDAATTTTADIKTASSGGGGGGAGGGGGGGGEDMGRVGDTTGLFQPDALSDAEIATFRQRGWLVVPGVVDDTSCTAVRDGIVRAINWALFERSGETHRLTCEDFCSFDVLTDAECRSQTLSNPNLIYAGGRPNTKPNTHRPLLSKASGMGPVTNWYFLPEKEVCISSNPRVYSIVSRLLHNERALLFEPERVSIKVRGTGDMPRVRVL